MDAQRCANTLEPLKQMFSFKEGLKTTTLTKSKPCNHLSFYVVKLCFIARSLQGANPNFALTFRGPFFFLDRALCAIVFSVLDIGVIY